MESPRLAGFRQGNRGYEVTADAALQDVRKPSLIELERMRGHLATDDQGGMARLSAASGLFDTAREALDLKDDIRIWTDKGEEARLRSAAVVFKTGSVSSQEPVTVSTPRATVNANALDVVESGKRISFVGNVHVVIVNDDAADKAPPRILTSNAEPAEVSR
jgi:lipopolysaccharide export system protein LptC